MASLLLVLTTIALVDSLSMLPFGVPILVSLLGSKRGLSGCVAFLAGIFVVYFPSGLLLALGFDAILERFEERAMEVLKNPGAIALTIQIVIGLGLVVAGYRMAEARRGRGERGNQPGLSPAAGFALGAGSMLVGMPGALPYFAAVDQILRADAGTAGSVGALLFYNLVFLLPLALVPVLRATLGSKSDGLFQAIDRFLDAWGRRVIVTVLVALGVVLVADGIGWFLGHPILPVPE